MARRGETTTAHYYEGAGADKLVLEVLILPQPRQEECRDSSEGHVFRSRLLSEVTGKAQFRFICKKCGASKRG